MSKPDDSPHHSWDDPHDQPPDGPRGAHRFTQYPQETSFARISSLQDHLDEITQRTRSLVPAQKLAPSERAVAELFATGIEKRILPIGSPAPEFSLPDATGRMVRSTDLLALGPLVVNFFRGRWCSYCVQELEAWQRLYGLVRKRHAILIGISPQTIRQNNFAASQHKFTFPLLSDEGVWIARRFGLDYTVPDYLRRYYRSIMVNVPLMNGEQSWRLPIPATYVIAQDSTILYARAYADFRVRPEPAEVLAAMPRPQP